MATFELEGFIDGCRAAVARGDGSSAVREIVSEAMASRGAVLAALGESEQAGLKPLYRADDLTIFDFTWAPWMCMKPHNHEMWSVVGLLSGREDNVFWQPRGQSIEARGARSLGAGEVAVLGSKVIHSVTNPIGKWTRAIHVYGGDFFAPPRPRVEWDPETLTERPWDMDDTRRLFARADARARAVVC